MNAVVAADFDTPTQGSVVEIAPGILWLRMPLPFELDHINLYLLDDGEGWIAVDCGLSGAQTEQVWEAVFENDLQGKPIKQVIATHSHVDHLGAAGWLCRYWDAPLLMTQPEYMYATDFLAEAQLPAAQDQIERVQFFHNMGMCAKKSTTLLDMGASIAGLFDALPKAPRWLSHGMQVEIGGDSWQIIVSEGHTIAHASLYCAERGILISGDQVLPRISSNVSTRQQEPEGNPLKSWLESLAALKSLPNDTLVLPSHEFPFFGLHQRLNELAAGHEKALDTLLTACAEPQTVMQLVAVLYPRKLSIFDLFLGCGECLAHLNYLLAEQKLVRTLDENDVHQYCCA